MKLIINSNKVKIIHTPQGSYLKTLAEYKYLVVLLPDDSKYKKLDNFIYLNIDDDFYKRKRLYRFDEEHIEQFRIKE